MTSVSPPAGAVDLDLVEVVIGVDTHVHTHTAAVVSLATGALLATLTVAADATGYGELVEFAQEHSERRLWAVEGTGCHGAGLTRRLQNLNEVVVELDRPERARRRRGAKSDPIDAERAAREAMTRPRLSAPRQVGGQRQALAVLLAARRSAMESLAAAQRQIFAIVIAAPEPLRTKFRGPAGANLAAMTHTAQRLRHHAGHDLETTTTITVLRGLAQRARAAQSEADQHLAAITTLVTAWSHPGRCRDDGAFAMLAGTAPIPASSGKTVRYRLNRAGDRQLNRALHTVALVRLQRDARTRAYADRRRAQGKTDREIKRILKRYIARELYRQLNREWSLPIGP